MASVTNIKMPSALAIPQDVPANVPIPLGDAISSATIKKPSDVPTSSTVSPLEILNIEAEDEEGGVSSSHLLAVKRKTPMKKQSSMPSKRLKSPLVPIVRSPGIRLKMSPLMPSTSTARVRSPIAISPSQGRARSPSFCHTIG